MRTVAPHHPSVDAVVIAVAQTASIPGDVAANVARHVTQVRDAAARGAHVVVFPELSLTGYELDRIAADPSLTVTLDDPRLEPLRQVTAQLGVTALAGAPWYDGGARRLAALAMSPSGVRAYAKRHLHGDEPKVFVPGSVPLVLHAAGLKLAVGICADLADPFQRHELEALGVDAWLLGVLLTPQGYEADAERAARAARAAGATVVLANHAAPTGGWSTAGRSGAWFRSSQVCLPAAPSGAEDGLLVVRVGRRQS